VFKLCKLWYVCPQEWISKGHGEYREIPSERDFFAEVKESKNVVCHFYRDSTFRYLRIYLFSFGFLASLCYESFVYSYFQWGFFVLFFQRCKILDKHLAVLAKKHLETKFIKLNVEKAPFLTERLKIKVIPTLALVKDGKTKDYIVGFTDLGNTDEFPTEMLEWRLGCSSIINYRYVCCICVCVCVHISAYQGYRCLPHC